MSSVYEGESNETRLQRGVPGFIDSDAALILYGGRAWQGVPAG